MDNVFEFLKRHSSVIITTHDTADADGLGAEMVFSLVARSLGKEVKIINANPIPANFRFIDPKNIIETLDKARLPQGAALVMIDTSDEYNIGELREYILWTPEVFVIDHHEPSKFSTLRGHIDPGASSVSEIAVEMALAAGVNLPPEYAVAAYAGIVYDTGFFAYSKTTARTFKAALSLVENGVNPHDVYSKLNENSSNNALMLQRKVLSTMEIHNQGRVAVQILYKDDIEATGAHFEDAENFINVPMKSRQIEASVLLKESKEGQIRCSMRSKGKINVSKIAQSLGGGGHVAAAGFKSSLGLEETLEIVLNRITEALDIK
jgi:phosphoesterase RecJ-like protein